MFGDYAVHALWTDTTTMNTDKVIPYTCHGDLHQYTLNCTHVPTAYGNNDSDNQVSGGIRLVHDSWHRFCCASSSLALALPTRQRLQRTRP